MAIFKILLASFFVVAVLHLGSDCMIIRNVVDDSPASSPQPQEIDCDEACAARCQSSSRPNLCHRACGTCCDRCKCVPPGTSGNSDACPCYANMTTHHGRHKCP
ncbi:hypothetical protein Tsubulata_051229 [Turnera subulata]|uniref:Gibberellin-regulated protein n=1 Tax=Turnera subulata TaxID=218843 RepID=A0A9Q0JPN3_9ROSI|nr:hypothetical protein Tsubulata_051229 [Turnera subulata]